MGSRSVKWNGKSKCEVEREVQMEATTGNGRGSGGSGQYFQTLQELFGFFAYETTT